MDFSLFQAAKELLLPGQDPFLYLSGPAFFTQQEAEQWLTESDLGPEYKVREIQPMTF
jgi:nucleoside 2-deoxyribosyltransferase